MEAENSATDKIAAETVEAVDLPCLSRMTPGIIKIVIDGQDRITQDILRRKGAINLHHELFFRWKCVYSSIILSWSFLP